MAASTGAFAVVCDVSDAGQVAGAVASVEERFGRLDGLVLNAGVMVPGGEPGETTLAVSPVRCRRPTKCGAARWSTSPSEATW